MRILAAVILLAAVAAPAQAQQGDFWFGFAYNVSLPVSDLSDFAGDASFRGISMEGRSMVEDNISLGFIGGWNVFHEKTNEVVSVQDDNLQVQGTQLRTVNSYPILATGYYYFGNMRKRGLKPYLGFGAGVYRIDVRLDIGTARVVDEGNWHFGFMPEAGVVFPLGWRVGGFANVRYNYAFEAGNTPATQYFGLNLGVAWQ